MGTRHLIAAATGGAMKLAQYGQWDGYPSGQGVKVLAFARKMAADPVEACVFRERLEKCRWITDEECKAIDAKLAAREITMPAELSRDTSVKILDMVLEAPAGLALQDSTEFALDGLFCEWAYVLDLDTNTLEVYAGFNGGDQAAGRWAGLRGDDSEYAAVGLVATFSFDALPTDEEFIKACQKSDDEPAVTAWELTGTVKSWTIGGMATITVEFDPNAYDIAGLGQGDKISVVINRVG